MRIVCAAKHCKYSSESEDSSHVVFINFPNDDTSKIWAHHCGRTDLLMKSNEELHLNYYVCSHHIEDHYYVNKTDRIILEQSAVPTLFESEISTGKSTSIYDRSEDTVVEDNVALTFCDMNDEIDQYQDISIRFSKLCRICGGLTSDDIEIFSAKGIELKLKDKINIHMPISVDMEDPMPQKLCLDCCNKLEVIHSLVVTCLRTDMRLKKFLNIGGEPDYDSRYNTIVEECSLEVAEELCIDETTQRTSVDIPANKIEEIVQSHHLSTELSHLETENTQKNSFESATGNEISSLNSFIKSYDEVSSKKSHDIMKPVVVLQDNNKTAESNEILYFHCKDLFKTDLFKEEEVMLVQKQSEIPNITSKKDCKNAETVGLQVVSKTCNICQQNFISQKLFDEHKLLYCKLSEEGQCNENYNARTNSHNVNTIALMESNKKCGHCDIVCNTKKELLSHITKCHGGKFLFKCFTCDKTYEKWSSLDVHEATHRIDKPYLCDLCGKSFKHSNNLRGHKRSHLDESRKKRHICEVCGNAFRSRFHLREHTNEHNGNKPYSCEQCGKSFYKRIQLRQHKLSHGLSRHACPICGATFNRRGNMTTHIKRHSIGDGAYTCSVCAYRCSSMSELKLHRKKHTEQDIIESIRKKCVDKTIWQCKICNRVFSQRAVLLNHERIHRGEKISVDCDVCGKKLSSKSSLIYHKKSIHSTERPHMCQYCGESFVSKESRLIHERTHTGERPYVCEICNMQYKCSSNLNQHMKIHSGIRPYKCAYCNKCFTRKGALNVHERIHTGIKPFPCETCGRSFSQKNDMLKHTKTHDVKSMRCEQCSEVFTKKKDILKHLASHEQSSSVIQEYVEQQMQPYTISITCSQIE